MNKKDKTDAMLQSFLEDSKGDEKANVKNDPKEETLNSKNDAKVNAEKTNIFKGFYKSNKEEEKRTKDKVKFILPIIISVVLLISTISVSNANSKLKAELELAHAGLNQLQSISKSTSELNVMLEGVTKAELEYLGYTSDEATNLLNSVAETIQKNESKLIEYMQSHSDVLGNAQSDLETIKSSILSANNEIYNKIKGDINKKYAQLSSDYNAIKLHEKANEAERKEYKGLPELSENTNLISMIILLHSVDVVNSNNTALNQKIEIRVVEEANAVQAAELEKQRIANEEAANSASSSNTNSTSAQSTNVYYQNCDAVRAAGAAPIYSGTPGYAKHLDRDNDGIGCDK